MAAASFTGEPAIEDLKDELDIQRTILASLQDSDSQDASTLAQIAEARQTIADLQRTLKARQAKGQASSSMTAMNRNFRDVYAGPSGHSTPASASTSGASASGGLPRRKRVFPPHLDDDDGEGIRKSKSSRTTPSPLPTDASTPFAPDEFLLPEDATFIDLTGDDGDFEKLIEEQRRAFALLEQQKEDERVAKSLEEQLQGSRASPPPQTPRSSGPTAFDRILGRPTQSSGSQGLSSSQEGVVAGPSNTGSQPRRYDDTSMTGHDFGDEPRWDSNRYTQNDLDFIMDPIDLDPAPSNTSFGIWGNSRAANNQSIPYPTYNGYGAQASNAPAAELARRAALGRHDGYGPHVGSGLTSNSSSNSVYGHGASSSSGMHSNSFYQPSSSLGPRPGMLNSGLYDPFQGLSNVFGTPSFTPPYNSNGLSDIIHRSNNIDWANSLDALGRPLNSALRSYYEDLQDDPRKTAEEIKELLENIRPDEEIPEEDRIGTPEGLRYPLYPHQQLALQWMQTCEEGKNKGGILADDMGLGKTISTLALMVSRQSSDRVKTNLIVGPVALIKQWENEINKKLRAPQRLSVHLLHNKSATYEQLRKYDVVLTSYGKLGFEEKRYQKWVEEHPGADPVADPDLAKTCPLVHPKSKFYRVILDEAQCIKNANTLQSKASCRLNAKHRWCLTGTPMMNGIHELYSLIRFLRIAPYHNQKEFTKTFGCLSSKGARARSAGDYGRNKAMQALRALLRAIMLRRMKTSKLDGKPLLNLPPKTEEVAHVEFDEDERGFYTNLEARTKITFNKYLRAGTVGKNYSNILVLLLRLRQACCHPHLNLDVEYVGNSEVTKEDMHSLAKTLSPDVISRLKAADAEGFSCPICLDAVIDPTIVLPCGHNSCGECFATLVAGADENNLRSGGEEGTSLKCPECRGPINPKNVINLTAFKAVHMPEPGESNDEQGEAASQAVGEDSGDDSSDSGSDSEEDDDDSASDADGNGDLRDFIVPDDEDGDEKVTESSKENEDGVPSAQPSTASKGKGKARVKNKRSKRQAKSAGKGKNKEKVKSEEVKPHMLKTLRTEAKKNKAEYKRYMKYLKKNWLPSAKVSECCRILQTIQESGDKTIVFSQFTFLLDLLEIPVKYELGIKYCRYDGGMSRVQRDAAAQDFQDPTSRTKVMLVSLKAGNAGLNLTAANHVVIMDPFWNPYIEMQAVDRAHRIGQQKPVQVHRLLVKETVEDRIVALQEQKRQFVDAALDEGESKQLGRLSLRDLQYLFNGRD